MNRIGSLSKSEIEKLRLEDEDEFAKQLMSLAYGYAKKNPIPNYNYDDYGQELIIDILTNLSLFDDARGSFSTFCYIRFKLVKLRLTRMLSKRDIPGEEGFAVDFERLTNINYHRFSECEYNYYFDKLCDESKLYIGGFSISSIARYFNSTFSITQRKILDNINDIRKEVGICKLYTLK